MTEASAADLAVVIVNYETGAWLERCLRGGLCVTSARPGTVAVPPVPSNGSVKTPARRLCAAR